jgi:hypothetical protein
MAAPAALATVFPDTAGINNILGVAGVKWRLNDAQTGAISTDEQAYLTELLSEATAWVRFHLANYDLSDYPQATAGHWMVYRWSNIWVAFHLAKRRGNPAMGSLAEMYQKAEQTLEEIQAGQKTLADVAQIASPSMSVSNIRLDEWYLGRKQRVVPTTSDVVPARHDQAKDWVTSTIPERFP